MIAAFFAVARRPRWIAALLLALGIAASFAALGQWQLSRSFDTAAVVETPDSETVVPLATLAEPQTAVTQPQLGQRVTVSGSLVPGDLTVLSQRNNGTASGFWLVGHLVTTDGDSLAVALGFAATADAARAAGASAADELASRGAELTGRYLPSESPIQSDFENGERSALAVAELVNEWTDPGPVYGGYVVLDDPVGGLDDIISPEPSREVSLNLLNVFYAVEWALFAGFAVYLWYRVVRDVVEREADEAREATVD